MAEEKANIASRAPVRRVDFRYKLKSDQFAERTSPKPQPKSESYLASCIEPTLESAFQDVNESIESVRRRFPQAIIIGVAKAGTSAMKVMLSLHPQIVAPGKDEIKFFTKYWNAGLQWYLDQMPFSKPNEITIEKSPQFDRKCAPERIQYLFPHVKLILVVRHPIIRAISEYVQDVSTGRTASESSFEKEVMKMGKINQFYRPINQSAYDYHMRRW